MSTLDFLEALSPEQRAIVESFGRGQAIVAGAGCGKTTTLVAKCRMLLARDPKAKIIAVSFTEKSANDLRLKLSTWIDLREHRVTTIHGLCSSILREFPDAVGLEGDERILPEAESRALWERAFESLWSERLPAPVDLAFERLCRDERPGPLFQILTRARALEAFGAIDRLEQSEVERERQLAQLSRWMASRYSKLKNQYGALDFQDLETLAAQVVRNPEIARILSGRTDLILVDEFQDTNPIQAVVVEAFARTGKGGEPLSNLIVVGDPKQSIYRFRDADVSVFNELCARLPEKHVLSWNFRSRPAIIDWVNQVCEPLFVASSGGYDPLVARRDEGQVPPVVRLDCTQNPDLAPDLLASWLKLNPAGGSTALLLRRIRGNEKWIQALRRAGLQVAISSGGFFWEDPRVREMVAFLKWRAFSGNALSLATLLRAPWMAISDVQIDTWIRSPEGLSEAFLNSPHPLAERLRQKVGRPLAAFEELEQLLWSEEAEQELGVAWLGLWHRAHDLTIQGMGLHACAERFARAIEEGVREKDVPPPIGPDQITIMTVHGSKGLEFDRVILVEFKGSERAPKSPMIFWDRQEGVLLGVRDDFGERDKEAESVWRQRESIQAQAESQRIFYVALTRAKEQLIQVISGDVSKAIEKPRSEWLSWVAPHLSRLPSEALSADTAEHAQTSKTVQSMGFADPQVQRPAPKLPSRLYRARHSVSEWVRLSQCSRQYVWSLGLGSAPAPAQLKQEFTGTQAGSRLKGGLSQAELGTEVHRHLERQDWEGLRDLERRVGRDRLDAEAVIHWGQRSLAVTDSAARSELSFEAEIQEEVIAGTIDRIEMREGRCLVTDYKVLAAEPATDELLHRYESQLKLYAWAAGRIDAEWVDRIDGRIIAFSTKGVREVVVKIPAQKQLNAWVLDLAQQSRALVASLKSGNPADPKPHVMTCSKCEFSNSCDASLTTPR